MSAPRDGFPRSTGEGSLRLKKPFSTFTPPWREVRVELSPCSTNSESFWSLPALTTSPDQLPSRTSSEDQPPRSRSPSMKYFRPSLRRHDYPGPFSLSMSVPSVARREEKKRPTGKPATTRPRYQYGSEPSFFWVSPFLGVILKLRPLQAGACTLRGCGVPRNFSPVPCST